MERAVEIPESGEVAVEDADPSMPADFSFDNAEDISEDWVSLFLNPSGLDEHFSSLPPDFEPYPHHNCTLEDATVKNSSENPLAHALLIDSKADHLLHSDYLIDSSSNLLQSFEEDRFSEKSLGSVDVAVSGGNPIEENCHPPSACSVSIGHSPAAYGAHEACAPSGVQVNSPASSLTQLSGDSNSGMETDSWKGKKPSSEMLVMLKQESTGEVSSGSESPISRTSANLDEKNGSSHILPLDNNALQSSCTLLQCEEGGLGTRAGGSDAVPNTVCSAQSGNLSSTPQSESFGVRHLQSIGNALKVGLLGKSGDRKRRAEDAAIENLQGREHGGAVSSASQGQESIEDQQSDQDKKDELGEEDDEKRRARLMRNRESAQLSRQRKKVYVDELEGRLRTMSATVAELNATISHLTAENVNLRRQLGYYFQPPGICPRPAVPMIASQAVPMGPYPGLVGGRPIYPGGPIPLIPIPRLKSQPPARSSKRSKSGAVKDEGGPKKQAKIKVAGAASVAMLGLLCVAMLCSPFDWGQGTLDRVGVHNSGSFTRVGDVRVGGRVLTSWSEAGSPINLTGGNTWEPGPEWKPLEIGEYGPEREGVPSVHTPLAAEMPRSHTATISPEVVRCSPGDANTTFSHPPEGVDRSQSNCYDAVQNPTLMEGGHFEANSTQEFAASVFVPRENRLVKVDGNLIIQSVMAGDRAARLDLGKKRKSGVKKAKGVKHSPLATMERQIMKAAGTKALDNLASKSMESHTRDVLVTERALAESNKSPLSTIIPSTVLRTGSLQQWLLGGLHVLKNKNMAMEAKKKEANKLSIDNQNAIAVAQGTLNCLSPYAAAPRGPLNSWVFGGLSTEPLMPHGNVNGTKEIVPPGTMNGWRLETSLLPWAALPFVNHTQQSEKKAYDMGFCHLPTPSKLYWAAAAKTELAEADSQQCLLTNRPIFSTGMCTELFQFDTSPSSPEQHTTTPEAKDVGESVGPKAAPAIPRNVSSKLSVPLVPKSRRDPFAVPLPPVRPKNTNEKGEQNNGTDPRVEKIVREQIHNRNLQTGASSLVVSVLAGPEEYGDSRRKGSEGMSQIFVVVLVDNQHYVTYSCMLPSGGPQSHVVAN